MWCRQGISSGCSNSQRSPQIFAPWVYRKSSIVLIQCSSITATAFWGTNFLLRNHFIRVQKYWLTSPAARLQRMATARTRFFTKYWCAHRYKQDLLFSTFKTKGSQALHTHTPWTCWSAHTRSCRELSYFADWLSGRGPTHTATQTVLLF